MPEGPSIVILKEEASIFKGKKVLSAIGNAKQDLKRIEGQKVVEFKTWGKQLLICFKDFYIRVHLLLFGKYAINEQKDLSLRLSLKFENGELNIYNGSVIIKEGNPDKDYDWELDTMSDKWNGKRAYEKLKTMDDTMLCDALVDQDVFAGSGNIIKNEIEFMMYLHPETPLGTLTDAEKKKLVKMLRDYCFDFYKWKKAFVFRDHWQIYRQRECPRCHIPVTIKVTGKSKRRSFICTNCQELRKMSKKKRAKAKT